MLASITYPSYTGTTDPQVNYSYDGTGAMISATDWLGDEVSFAHDSDGNLTAQDNNVTDTNGGTSSTDFSYDAADQPTQTFSTFNQTCSDSPDTLTQEFSRNDDGQLSQAVASYSGSCADQPSEQDDYSYDPAGRVIYEGTSPQDGSGDNFAYDASGDPTTLSGYDPSEYLTTYTQTYDNAGELTSQTPQDGYQPTYTYTYDTLGDQASITTASTAIDYGYDQAGQMTTAATPTETTNYLYNGDGLEAAAQPDGSNWSTANIDGTTAIWGVSCPTATFCAAVDNNGNVITYNGTDWSSPEDIDGTNALYTISCASATFCAAVDTNGNLLTYDGTTWSSSQDIDGTNELDDVSCPSATFCAAVDDDGNALIYNGTSWSSPEDIDGTNTFDFVSCPSATFCAAVDDDGNVVTYNGTDWSSPDDIDGTTALSGISCPTATFCAAVDYNNNALTYNGTTWSTPETIDSSYYGLWAVSCPTTTSCTAVDGSGNALTYNGTTWSSPDDIDGLRAMNTISCPTTTFCATVDYNGDALTYLPTTTTQLTWDTNQTLPLILSDNTNDYIYGPSGTPVEQINLSTSTPTYLTYTASNDTWISTNESGDETGYWGYDAYGTLAFGAPTSPFGYSGQYQDATTGLVNDRARWYEPQTGGFTTRDPDFSSTDTAYTYADADPVNNSDPSGQSCSTWEWIVFTGPCAVEKGVSVGVSAALQPFENQVNDLISNIQSEETDPAVLNASGVCGSSTGYELVSDESTDLSNTQMLAAITDRLRLPDYVSLEVGAGVIPIPGLPITGSVGGVLTFTRYGSVYFGPSAGVSEPGISGTVEAGWLDEFSVPSEKSLNGFVSGNSIELGGYLPVIFDLAGPAAAEVWGNVGQLGGSDFSTQVGVGAGVERNIALTWSYSFHLTNSGPKW